MKYQIEYVMFNHTYEVEAENEDTAIELADEMFLKDGHSFDDLCDVEAYEVK